jgi:hypothetical protein
MRSQFIDSSFSDDRAPIARTQRMGRNAHAIASIVDIQRVRERAATALRNGAKQRCKNEACCRRQTDARGRDAPARQRGWRRCPVRASTMRSIAARTRRCERPSRHAVKLANDFRSLPPTGPPRELPPRRVPIRRRHPPQPPSRRPFHRLARSDRRTLRHPMDVGPVGPAQ